jgi:hypothetical protein
MAGSLSDRGPYLLYRVVHYLVPTPWAFLTCPNDVTASPLISAVHVRRLKLR